MPHSCLLVRRLAWCLVGIFLLHSSLQAQTGPRDVKLVIGYVEQEAGTIHGDVRAFTRLTQPYAPLDFQVRMSSSAEASATRNYLFGVASSMAGLEGDVAPSMARKFHCGSPCAESRMQVFAQQNQPISTLVKAFVPVTGLMIVSQWGVDGEYRVNDTFVRGTSLTRFEPEGATSIIPNSEGVVVADLSRGTGLSPSNIEVAKSFATQLNQLGLAAIVRSAQGIRVIRNGNADNQAGLLFKRLDQPEPKQGDQLGEGLEINGVAKLAPDIYYFETN